VNAEAGHNFTWSPTDGIENPNSLNTVIKPEVSTSYVLTAPDLSTGCIAKDTLNILVTTGEAALDSVQFCVGTNTELTLPQSVNDVYKWSNGDSTQTITVSSEGLFIGEYTTDLSGCVGKLVFDVRIIDCDKILQVPQAFTPDGDGINDFFTVFGKNVVEYEIRIFNRWGEQVYHSDDPGELNNLSDGWDGTHKGKLQNTATFVYYVKATDANNIAVEKKGNVTLIR
jgi:gliding motility-associated-like protein